MMHYIIIFVLTAIITIRIMDSDNLTVTLELYCQLYLERANCFFHSLIRVACLFSSSSTLIVIF